MGQARHPLSLLALFAVAVTVLATGCSSSDDESQRISSGRGGALAGAPAQTCAVGKVAGAGRIRVSGVQCTFARGIVAAWYGGDDCSGSDVSCSIGDYRCLGAATAGGLAVNCTAPGRSISFLAPKRG